MVDMFQKAGVDLTDSAPDLAAGKAGVGLVHHDHARRPGDRAGERGRRIHDQRAPGHVGRLRRAQPDLGHAGSPNAQDWLAVDLGRHQRFDTVKLYFYSDKDSVSGGNTYREPAAYTVQYFDGHAWVDAPAQVRRPASPLPNYNRVDFPPVKSQRVRVLVTPRAGCGVGLKEVQVFDKHQRRRSREAGN